MHIDKKSPIPVYYQLKNILLKKIQNGEYTADSLIPSERDLGESLNISRMTVRQALNQLVSEGVLYREKGKGTFVSRSKIEQRNIMSFSDIVLKKGLIPTTRILCFNKEQVDDETAAILGLKPEENVFVIKRLRLASGTPVGIEEAFIPEKHCPGLDNYDLTSSLYKLIKEEYSYPIRYVDNVIEASRASKEEITQLCITKNVPVLKVNSVNYTDSDLKLFYERSVYRSDEYKYSVLVYV